MHFGVRIIHCAAAMLTLGSVMATAVPVTQPSRASAETPARFVSGWIPNWSSAVVTEGTDALTGGQGAVFADVSPFGFSAVSATTIATSGSENSLTAAVNAARINRLPVLPSITDGTGKLVMAGILKNPASRAQHVQAITNLVVNRNYDGIDLDYEGFAFADGRTTWDETRPAWAAFVIELGDALHGRGKLLSVTVPPIWNNGASGYPVYSWHQRGASDIMPSVDRLRLMVYDWSVSVAGAVAPMHWVNNVLSYVKAAVPADQLRKVQMGVPTYGRSWARVLSGSCPVDAPIGTIAVQMENVGGLLAKPGAVLVRDDSGELKLTYDEVFSGSGTVNAPPEYVPPPNHTDSVAPADPDGLRTAVRLGGATCAIRRTVFFPDETTVLQRAHAAVDAGLSGIVLWALGYETDALWPNLMGMDVPRPNGDQTTGSLDAASVATGGVYVKGWVMDLEYDLPVTFTVAVTNPGQQTVVSGPIVARLARQDVAGRIAHADQWHGFELIVPTPTASGAVVCIRADGYGFDTAAFSQCAGV